VSIGNTDPTVQNLGHRGNGRHRWVRDRATAAERPRGSGPRPPPRRPLSAAARPGRGDGRRRLPRPGRDAGGGAGRPPGVLRLPDPPRDHPGDRLLRPSGQGGRGRDDREHVADLRPGRRQEPRRPRPLGRRAGLPSAGRGSPSRTCGRHSSPSGFYTTLRWSRPGRSPGCWGPASTHRSRPRTRPASSWASSRTRPLTAARSTRCSDQKSTRPRRSRRSWAACWARTSATSRSPARNFCRPGRRARQPAPGQVNARTGCGELEQLQRGELKESFLLQHLREVARDHQNGVFAGTNDLIETIGGRPPMTLEEFINKHRAAFAA